MGTQFSDSDKFEVNEVEVNEHEWEDDLMDDLSSGETLGNRQRQRAKQAHRMRRNRAERKNKYGWAFFLCSLFVGLGFTAATGAPLPLFLGLGIGFLFFVDPIYQRVMDLFERR